MTMGTLTVAGTLVRLLSERMQSLVDRLADAARTDPLTGLLNRRGLTERGDIEFSRARRAGQPLAIVLCDLDHFKAVNDLCGHDSGDQVLERFANLLRVRKRGLDAAARNGASAAEVMRAADAALYAAKLGGRDRAVLSVATPATPAPPRTRLRQVRPARNPSSA